MQDTSINIILFDDEVSVNLRPLTLTRPSALLRCGILTIEEKWKHYLKTESSSYHTADYLSGKYPVSLTTDNLFINGRLLPEEQLVNQILKLELGQALYHGNSLLAFRNSVYSTELTNKLSCTSDVQLIERCHNLFTFNHKQIESDFYLLTAGRTSAQLSNSNITFGKHPIFIEEGVFAEAAVFNTNDGPIYLGRNSEVMEGATIRGPFALCEGSSIKMGAKIYTGTTIGPHSKVGGEVSNSVILGFSNKGHDGFLGNSVIGEWCNLGADSNNSNLKNNYEEVKLWNYNTGNFEKTGLQFCGLIMGDHSKCGINTMFNTGTVVGVSANIFGSGFPRNFVPSFSWGGAAGFETYLPKKAYQTAKMVMERRKLNLSELDIAILDKVFELESSYRNWEK